MSNVHGAVLLYLCGSSVITDSDIETCIVDKFEVQSDELVFKWSPGSEEDSRVHFKV